MKGRLRKFWRRLRAEVELLKLALVGALLLLALAAPARAGVVPELNVTGAAIVARDVSSTSGKPFVFLSETVLGPHYSGLYIGGAGASQGNGVGLVIPLATYVFQGYVHGLFRGLVVQVGFRQPFTDGSKRSYYAGIGVSR